MARIDLIRRSDALDALQIVGAWSTREQRRALSQTYDKLHRVSAVDAVDVVRCKDCKRRGTSYECPYRNLMFTEAEGYHYVDKTTADGFCSFGERKEVSHGVDGEKRADPSV
ncbi:MAG: hypothetical protein IKK34_14445 [Clostridia bacterium]|nr:hypothetical protein [Clostridia bacterium]